VSCHFSPIIFIVHNFVKSDGSIKNITSFKVFLGMLCPYNAFLYFFMGNQNFFLEIQDVGHYHAFSNVLSLFEL
jgi:hypothetical protein